MTYPCDPEPAGFLGAGSARGIAVPGPDTVERALELAAASDSLSSEASLAFDLYSKSFFVSESADSRFLMLMMAVETLIDQKARPEHVAHHVEALMSTTRQNASLTKSESDSIIGSLRWLFKESVSAAGKALASELGDRKYNGSPAVFFGQCYAVRSRLVHGYVPRPSIQDVGVLAANLVHFVGHLIAGFLLTSELHPITTA